MVPGHAQLKGIPMGKNTTAATADRLMQLLIESAAREERQRAEIHAALADATQEWLATLDEQKRTDFFAAIEAAASSTVTKKLAKHPDRPIEVEALVAKAREAEVRQKDAERQRKLDAAEERDLARLAALKEKYEGDSVGKSRMPKDQPAS